MAVDLSSSGALRRRHYLGSRGSVSVTGVRTLWESLVEVLCSIDSPSSALLCTADGVAVAAYGLSKTEVPRVCHETGSVFAARTPARDAGADAALDEVQTVELTSGRRLTVIASVPGTPCGEHLLSVTAEGVSLPLLQAWTRLAAEDLGKVLATQP